MTLTGSGPSLNHHHYRGLSKIFDRVMMRSVTPPQGGHGLKSSASEGENKATTLRISDFTPCTPPSKNNCYKNSFSSEQSSKDESLNGVKKDVAATRS